jgi:hypothetical protein
LGADYGFTPAAFLRRALVVSSSTVAKFTQADIEGLIGCPKTVSTVKKRIREGAHWRLDADLLPADETKGTFSMFMRQNLEFGENFSVGLRYCSNDDRGEIVLLRCNGIHGLYNGQGSQDHPHFDYHIHTAREDAIDAGERPEKYAVKTKEFASVEEAMQYFVKRVNIVAKDVVKYFPSNRQIPLFNAE